MIISGLGRFASSADDAPFKGSAGLAQIRSRSPRHRQTASRPDRSPQTRGRMAWRKSILGVIAASSILALVPTASAHSTHLFSKSFAGAGDSQLAQPEGLAVDQTSNDVYVGDPANARVEKFDSSGNFILMFGKGVNKTKDEEAGSTEAEQNVCTVESSDVCKAGTPGSSPGAFTTPRFLAVDSSDGDVYVADTGTGLVQKFSSSGIPISSWGSNGQLAGTGLNSEPDFVHLLGIGVDSSGVLHVYNRNSYNDGILSEFESGGNYTFSFGAGYYPQSIGIAVGSNGDTYIEGNKYSLTGVELGLIARLESPEGTAVDPSNGDFFVDRRGEAIDVYVENCGNPETRRRSVRIGGHFRRRPAHERYLRSRRCVQRHRLRRPAWRW